MKVFNNYSLKDNNSFKIDIKAKYFVDIKNTEEIPELLKENKYSKEKIFILGGGTNLLFRKNYDGLVIHISTKGIRVIENNSDSIVVEVEAGEAWNGFVQWAVNNSFSGVENMVLIPGTIGGAASQNIAAYGQNFEDVFDSLDAIDVSSGKITIFDKKLCNFGYRESFFKKDEKNRFIISKVRLRLGKKVIIDTSYHSRYESLEGELSKFANPPYNIRDIAKAVSVIRERKFPDWEKIGTVGSFFLILLYPKSS